MSFLDYINGKYGLMEKTVEIIGILVVGYIFVKILKYIMKKALKRSTLDSSTHSLIIRIAAIVVWILIGLSILAATNVNMAPFITMLGAIGMAIALAMRDSLANVAGGIILLFTKPFVAGDEIEINGTIAVVDHIDLLTTQLHTFDNRDIIMPNGSISNNMVINASRREIRRVSCIFYVKNVIKIGILHEFVNNFILNHPILLLEPAPWINVKNRNEFGAIIEIGIWCKTENRGEAKLLMDDKLREELYEAGIESKPIGYDMKIYNDKEN